MFETVISALNEGFVKTFEIFVATLIGALPLGLLLAFGTMSKFKPLALLARAYISIMRGTPLMLQMFAIYFAPFYVFGIELTPASKWQACVVAFIVNYAAYFAEIYRSGIQSVPRGQYEAAEVLGYSSSQTFFRIVLPQAGAGHDQAPDLLQGDAAAGDQAHPAAHGQRDHHAREGHVAGVLHRRGRDVLHGQGPGGLAGKHGAVCHRGRAVLGVQLHRRAGAGRRREEARLLP